MSQRSIKTSQHIFFDDPHAHVGVSEKRRHAPSGKPWAHRTGDVYHRIKLKETGESGGLTVTDADEAMRCYSEEFKGTWTKGWAFKTK